MNPGPNTATGTYMCLQAYEDNDAATILRILFKRKESPDTTIAQRILFFLIFVISIISQNSTGTSFFLHISLASSSLTNRAMIQG
jgi:hypothetical protein